MNSDPFSQELREINAELEAAGAILDERQRRSGVGDGAVLMVDANDAEAVDAVRRIRVANARLTALLAQYSD